MVQYTNDLTQETTGSFKTGIMNFVRKLNKQMGSNIDGRIKIERIIRKFLFGAAIYCSLLIPNCMFEKKEKKLSKSKTLVIKQEI